MDVIAQLNTEAYGEMFFVVMYVPWSQVDTFIYVELYVDVMSSSCVFVHSHLRTSSLDNGVL